MKREARGNPLRFASRWRGLWASSEAWRMRRGRVERKHLLPAVWAGCEASEGCSHGGRDTGGIAVSEPRLEYGRESDLAGARRARPG